MLTSKEYSIVKCDHHKTIFLISKYVYVPVIYWLSERTVVMTYLKSKSVSD